MKKEPLFRRVNTTARGVHHRHGGDFSDLRNTKAQKLFQGNHQSMHGKQRRGLDYTPLFRFLLSKAGEDWDSVYSEALSRLDKPGPIFWLVAKSEHERRDCVRVGESTYFSGLYVDETGVLRRVNPDLRVDDLYPFCGCCTHTFNGTPFTNSFDPTRVR
ncbi:MAG TPA: hypothetical protein VLC46_08335 [Thermoanaerobaculia bacterium]|jgi:hypothetical protein|nr:hypothetical protein [Thermoanaerobaculia bacterium]